MNEICSRLFEWYSVNKRDLPWRATRDPYLIWISEVILQQTRVAQGYDYFVRFVERFPAVEVLAQASEDEVMRQWQGLGYYSRARNLHKAAQLMREHEMFNLINDNIDNIARQSTPCRALGENITKKHIHTLDIESVDMPLKNITNDKH